MINEFGEVVRVLCTFQFFNRDLEKARLLSLAAVKFTLGERLMTEHGHDFFCRASRLGKPPPGHFSKPVWLAFQGKAGRANRIPKHLAETIDRESPAARRTDDRPTVSRMFAKDRDEIFMDGDPKFGTGFLLDEMKLAVLNLVCFVHRRAA